MKADDRERNWLSSNNLVCRARANARSILRYAQSRVAGMLQKFVRGQFDESYLDSATSLARFPNNRKSKHPRR